MTNETLLSYIYILKNKEGKKKKKQALERVFKPRPACLGLVLFLLIFYKDVDDLSFIPIFIYIKKKTQTMCCLQAQILATTVVHETSGQPLFWLKKLNF